MGDSLRAIESDKKQLGAVVSGCEQL